MHVPKGQRVAVEDVMAAQTLGLAGRHLGRLQLVREQCGEPCGSAGDGRGAVRFEKACHRRARLRLHGRAEGRGETLEQLEVRGRATRLVGEVAQRLLAQRRVVGGTRDSAQM